MPLSLHADNLPLSLCPKADPASAPLQGREVEYNNLQTLCSEPEDGSLFEDAELTMGQAMKVRRSRGFSAHPAPGQGRTRRDFLASASHTILTLPHTPVSTVNRLVFPLSQLLSTLGSLCSSVNTAQGVQCLP